MLKQKRKHFNVVNHKKRFKFSRMVFFFKGRKTRKKIHLRVFNLLNSFFFITSFHSKISYTNFSASFLIYVCEIINSIFHDTEGEKKIIRGVKDKREFVKFKTLHKERKHVWMSLCLHRKLISWSGAMKNGLKI